MQHVDFKILFALFCILHLSCVSEGRPLRKRTVTEVQLMHNLREHKHVQARQEWLQTRLHGIHTALAQDSSRQVDHLGSREVDEAKSRLQVEDLTSEEIQYALSFLEKLLKSKQS